MGIVIMLKKQVHWASASRAVWSYHFEKAEKRAENVTPNNFDQIGRNVRGERWRENVTSAPPGRPFANYGAAIGVCKLHRVRRSADLVALKLWKGRSGILLFGEGRQKGELTSVDLQIKLNVSTALLHLLKMFHVDLKVSNITHSWPRRQREKKLIWSPLFHYIANKQGMCQQHQRQKAREAKVFNLLL